MKLNKFFGITVFLLISTSFVNAEVESLEIELSTPKLSITGQNTFQVNLKANLPIKNISKNFLILNNGELLQLKKKNENEFTVLIKPKVENGFIKVKVRENSVEGGNGLKNKKDSNELEISLSASPSYFSHILNNLNNPFGSNPPNNGNNSVFSGLFEKIGGFFGGQNSNVASPSNLKRDEINRDENIFSKYIPKVNSANFPRDSRSQTQPETKENVVDKNEEKYQAKSNIPDKPKTEQEKKVDDIVKTKEAKTKKREIVFVDCKNFTDISGFPTRMNIPVSGKIIKIDPVNNWSNASQAGSFNSKNLGNHCVTKKNLVLLKMSELSNSNSNFIVFIDASRIDGKKLDNLQSGSCTILEPDSLVSLSQVTGFASSDCTGQFFSKDVSGMIKSSGLPTFFINPSFKIYDR